MNGAIEPTDSDCEWPSDDEDEDEVDKVTVCSHFALDWQFIYCSRAIS